MTNRETWNRNAREFVQSGFDWPSCPACGFIAPGASIALTDGPEPPFPYDHRACPVCALRSALHDSREALRAAEEELRAIHSRTDPRRLP